MLNVRRLQFSKWRYYHEYSISDKLQRADDHVYVKTEGSIKFSHADNSQFTRNLFIKQNKTKQKNLPTHWNSCLYISLEARSMVMNKALGMEFTNITWATCLIWDKYL